MLIISVMAYVAIMKRNNDNQSIMTNVWKMAIIRNNGESE